jgi:hypothetical protein
MRQIVIIQTLIFNTGRDVSKGLMGTGEVITIID